MDKAQSITIDGYRITGFGEFEVFMRLANEAIGFAGCTGSEGSTVEQYAAGAPGEDDFVIASATAERVGA